MAAAEAYDTAYREEELWAVRSEHQLLRSWLGR
jgi:hypothetical protein